MPHKFLGTALVAAALLAIPVSGAANNDGPGINSGILRCNVAGGWGFLFASSKDLKCVYETTDRRIERYTGQVQKLGIDIGYTEGGSITWAVFAPSTSLRQGGLSGTYVGATAEATAGQGVGANLLIGGTSAVSLQPLSVSGQKGINIAAGIGSITLNFFP
ncbi:MAG: DUF992 domain-containing protein [Rhodospirillaceae bacterium]|jgi:hypothetical protein|nr:DUF992 domain-containing protein [Rhodospirillaceae bacterium]